MSRVHGKAESTAPVSPTTITVVSILLWRMTMVRVPGLVVGDPLEISDGRTRIELTEHVIGPGVVRQS